MDISMNRPYVYMRKYINYNALSALSPKGKIRIFTSAIDVVTNMLQKLQDTTRDSGRFQIEVGLKVVDVIVAPNGNPVMIYEMINCEIERLRNQFYDKAVEEVGKSPASWLAKDDKKDDVIGAALVKTSKGDVEVRPVLKLGNDAATTKRLPSPERLMELGIIIGSEY